MRIFSKGIFHSLLLLTLLFSGCLYNTYTSKSYDEIPPMLCLLTNKAQSAIEQGYFAQGEQAVLDYLASKNPNVYNWFTERNFKVRVNVVDDYAVVLVCDGGKSIFEDTYCSSGPPDKDHREKTNQKACEFSMTTEEIKSFCE